jgi:tetratricopeptide (TPR) repeat protein
MERWEELNNEAMDFYQQGDLAMAEEKFMEAVKETEKFGPEDVRLSECMDNVIWIYHTRGKVAEAEEMIRRSLAIQEKAYGRDNQYISWNLSLLAEVCQGQGKFEEAEGYFRRAIAIDEKSIGPDAPSVAKYLQQCAEVLRKLGNPSEADAMESRANSIRAKQSPPKGK